MFLVTGTKSESTWFLVNKRRKYSSLGEAKLFLALNLKSFPDGIIYSSIYLLIDTFMQQIFLTSYDVLSTGNIRNFDDHIT
jgi:hypothetical protein